MIYIQALCFLFTGTRSFADEVTQLSNNNSATSLIIEDVSLFTYVCSRNYKYEQQWKLGKFLLVCGKKIEELFASTLNGIPISVRCVSSMIVVLNAKFAQLLAAHANKKGVEKR